MEYRNPLRCDRRQPRSDRYIDLPPDQWSREWMVSVIQHMDCILENGLAHAIQDLADQIDYGPNQLSPRQYADFAKVADAFNRAVLEQAEKCTQGAHLFIGGDPRCRHCRTARFTIVESE